MDNHHLGGGQWIKACQLEPDLVLRSVRDAKGRPAGVRGGGGMLWVAATMVSARS
jgi:hypothetical protein